jgi:hypothetical protein
MKAIAKRLQQKILNNSRDAEKEGTTATAGWFQQKGCLQQRERVDSGSIGRHQQQGRHADLHETMKQQHQEHQQQQDRQRQ